MKRAGVRPPPSLLRLLAAEDVDDSALAQRIDRERLNPHELNQRKETPLHLACGRGLQACVRALLQAGADANARDWRHSTPLLRSIARAGSLDIVEMLIGHGVDLNPASRAIAAPLVQAVASKRVDIARRLVAAGADPKRCTGAGTVLHAAVDLADPKICRAVLDWAVDLEAENMIGETTLSMAVNVGEPAVVQLLVEAGADPHRKSGFFMTPWERAVDIGEKPVIHALEKKRTKRA